MTCSISLPIEHGRTNASCRHGGRATGVWAHVAANDGGPSVPYRSILAPQLVRVNAKPFGSLREP
jgi:hypothetical protein